MAALTPIPFPIGWERGTVEVSLQPVEIHQVKAGIFAVNLLHMKRLQPDIAVEDDSEQVWIAKYRAAISEPPPKPLFKRMVGHLGYVVGIILGKSKRAFTAAPPKPQLVKGTGIKKKRLFPNRERNKPAHKYWIPKSFRDSPILQAS